MPDDWINKLRGRFVVFDGPDGSGKTTQFHRMVRHLERHGLEVEAVREPGGTTIGEKLRRMLLDPENDMMAMRCEMLLYMASRAQLVAERLAPAMEAGRVVIADRFVSSTLAYQGTAGGISEDEIMAVAKVAVDKAWPDAVVVFDVDEQTAAKRLNPLLDRIEQRGADYHRRVRAGYLRQAEHDPQRYTIIDARDDADTVFARLLSKLEAATNRW